MNDVMLEEAKLWFDEPPQRKRKLETPVNPPPPPPAVDEDSSSDDEVDPVAWSKYNRQVSESGVVLLKTLPFIVSEEPS